MLTRKISKFGRSLLSAILFCIFYVKMTCKVDKKWIESTICKIGKENGTTQTPALATTPHPSINAINASQWQTTSQVLACFGDAWKLKKTCVTRKEASTADRLAQPPETKDKGPKPGFDVGIAANACVTLESRGGRCLLFLNDAMF